MAFTVYTGLPGSGKSYNVVKHILIPGIEAGRNVWTNIPLHDDVWIERYAAKPTYFETDDIKENPRWFEDILPAGALLVLDEAQELWPTGMNVNQFSDSHKTYLSKHRHMVGEDGISSQLILVSQDCEFLAKYVRSLTQFTFHHKKLVELGLNKYVVTQYRGAVGGDNPSQKRKMNSSSPRAYSSNITELYKSSTLTADGSVGDEVRADKRSTIWGTSKPWMYLAMALLFPFLAYVGFSSYFGNLKSDSQAQTETNQANQANQVNQVNHANQANQAKSKEPFKDYDVFIVANIGVFPRINYKFSIRSKDSYSTLNIQQIRALGYSIQPIDSCVVKFVWRDTDRFVMCELPDDLKDEGFISNVI